MLDESKECLADVAETDCTDCAADKADAEEVRTLPPAAATGKLVEGTEVLAQAEEERQRPNRDRATNSVRCDGHKDSRPWHASRSIFSWPTPNRARSASRSLPIIERAV